MRAKKIIAVLLVASMSISMYACGSNGKVATSKSDTKSTTEASARDVKSGENLSKDEMLAQAEQVYTWDLAVAAKNIVNAKKMYCGKVIKLTGRVANIEEDYVMLCCKTSLAKVIHYIYLSKDDISKITGDHITVVGYVSDIESKEEQSGDKRIYKYNNAYLVNGNAQTQNKVKMVGDLYNYYAEYRFKVGMKQYLNDFAGEYRITFLETPKMYGETTRITIEALLNDLDPSDMKLMNAKIIE